MSETSPILWFEDVRRGDVARVGGKNASLGELTSALSESGIAVPPGFATTAEAYWAFIDANGLRQTLRSTLEDLSKGKVTLAEAFARRFDGFSIGSNDLTQLTLGVDRDSADLAALFDEEDPAVKWMITHVIEAAHRSGTKVGLCGQAPSDRPAFAQFLVECGIDSVSVTPDSFVAVKRRIAEAEAAHPIR